MDGALSEMGREAGTPEALWHERRLMLVIGAAYVLLATVVKVSAPFPDLTDFWVPACRLILEGRPQDLYTVRLPIYGHEFPNAYPPLFFALLAPFVALADGLRLGYGGSAGGSVTEGFGAGIVGLPLVCADVALAALLCRAAGTRLRTVEERLWVFALLLAQPLLWFSSVKVQHHESLLLGALAGAVLCIESGRVRWGIGLASLALCLKATALLALPALVLELGRKKGRMAALGMALAPLAAVGLMLGPWLWFRWDETSYSLLRFEMLRPIFGVSVAKLAVGTGLEPALVRWSNPVLLALAALVPVVLYRRGGSLRQSLACVFLLGLFGSRWVYPHYLVVPCGLLLLWELRQASLARLSLLTAGLLWALQSPYFPEVTLESGPGVRLRAGLWGLSLLGLTLYVASRDEPVS